MNNTKNICVIGDVMLDVYIDCTPRKVSAEAPVLILNKKQSFNLLGGAANVALNLKTLGYNVTLISICGKDYTRETIQSLCFDNGIDINVFTDENMTTPIKTRIIADKQQVVRFDDEKPSDSGIKNISSLGNIVKNKILLSDAIILSDYSKGSLKYKYFVQEVISKANSKDIPVFVDPIRKEWDRYAGAFCITPNLSELEEFMGIDTKNDRFLIEKICRSLIKNYALKSMVVTLGKDGAGLILRDDKEAFFVDSTHEEVFDVCGAGDTLIAALCGSYAEHKDIRQALITSNLAAGITVKKHGTATVTRAELQVEMERYNGTLGEI